MNRLKIAGGRFHFIGAGGVGMSGLARFLLGKKAIVTGSDQTAGAAVSRLREMGADIRVGHNADNLHPATDAVVISAAIRENNPELQAARQRGCRVYKYAQFLGELVKHFEGIAVAGTHGKSTTSGWLVYCLKQAGIDANFVVGADILQLGGSSGSGDSEFFVVEACEYDRSFHNLKPRIACILNIERDHLDCYKDEDDIVESFQQFALGTRPDGLVVADGDDPNVARVIAYLAGQRRCVTFGFDPQCTYCARNVHEDAGFYRFDVFQEGRKLGSTRVSLPGRHNVHNALAVVAIAVSIGVEPERMLEVLDGFQGMDRRLMLKGRFHGITVLDDYAHHPTKIKASLKAIRERYQPQRLWCVFQAHQYSRTLSLLDEFAASFTEADKVLVPEIFFARDTEAGRNAVNARILTERIRGRGTDAEYIASFDAVCDHLLRNVHAGDVVVAMGAGDVWKVADEYIQRLRNHC
ncbi:MAG: UDP-N-acetylmuramate--L-alanine ligase [Planctomycetes bacterium RBG_13_62_9]|nr:MAG: UDP-N-acetylmuramate--L-alanine ligase [Planctomycetes bacterium RBG_13_62_9]